MDWVNQTEVARQLCSAYRPAPGITLGVPGMRAFTCEAHKYMSHFGCWNKLIERLRPVLPTRLK